MEYSMKLPSVHEMPMKFPWNMSLIVASWKFHGRSHGRPMSSADIPWAFHRFRSGIKLWIFHGCWDVAWVFHKNFGHIDFYSFNG